MGCLSKTDFATPKSCKIVKHEIPSFGDGAYVCIRALSSKQFVELQKIFGKEEIDDKNDAFMYQLLAFCLVDDDGKPIYETPEEIKETFDQSTELLKELVSKATEVSGVGSDAKKN